MDINFEYYKFFYFVAKYGNITKAATALGSNQPNVTRIMKLLESQLNCRLFIREARGITLTQQGELLYSHVEIAYRHLLDAQEEICRLSAQDSGTVEIGATETALHLFLLNALHDFKLSHPAIKIKIHNHTTLETLKHLISGKLDFAVVTTPFEVPKAFSLVKILDFEEILVGGSQYADLCQISLELKDAKKYPWIGLGRESTTYHFYKNFFIQQGVDLDLDMEVATSDLMLPMIENNLGIGFVAKELALPLLKEKKLVQIHLNCDTPKRAIQIVSDKGRGKSLAADTFYRFLKSTSRHVTTDSSGIP
ncbi:LysR family transcriptional regulator [Parablautia muri]|uniref:LysR family transcriptional regulator n=1 Tax=Parablautia muri TaxID=2320879 RepID=A0A9X5GSJ9_9FIRM|nr:LysR family transcriptional regulator [Parablautia muri]NBJ94163.1 LysR family transcriptional regulator [Parablautia muri]